jgi:hypothetical protein
MIWLPGADVAIGPVEPMPDNGAGQELCIAKMGGAFARRRCGAATA